MTTKELIVELLKLPQDMPVFYVWDGDPRTEVEGVYESQSAKVILFTYDEYVSIEDMPKGLKAKASNTFNANFWFSDMPRKKICKGCNKDFVADGDLKGSNECWTCKQGY